MVFRELIMEVSLIPFIFSSGADMNFVGKRRGHVPGGSCSSEVLAQVIPVLLWLFPLATHPNRMGICHTILDPTPTSLPGHTDLAKPLQFS